MNTDISVLPDYARHVKDQLWFPGSRKADIWYEWTSGTWSEGNELELSRCSQVTLIQLGYAANVSGPFFVIFYKWYFWSVKSKKHHFLSFSVDLPLNLCLSGCLEEGLEALLKATGSNLLILKISHCPNLLTDRSLWLASCYCRALQAVTYR